jgi:rSAM/selenodomain-associated transferase 1
MAARQVVVMARWPAAGRCKRRLAITTGAAAAARVQQRLTAHTLATARLAADQAQAELLLAVDGLGPRAMARWGRALGADAAVLQGRGSLGRRMQGQLQRRFQRGAQQVVLIGTDLPGLEVADLTAAFDHLQQSPLVLGPAADGGYWLIGLTRSGFERAGAALMAGMPWGGHSVLQATLEAAAARTLKPALLRQQHDLDRHPDLAPWIPSRHRR